MNNISKTIEYCQWSWNVLTGCKHGCDYCYARRTAERFDGKRPMLTMRDNLIIAQPRDPFPNGFTPTWHPERLHQPDRKRPSIVFVCDMADLWGHWVPEWAQTMVLDACRQAPQHIYLLLTKSPENYPEDLPDNVWSGTTAESYHQLSRIETLTASLRVNGGLWVSCEPLLGPIAGDWVEGVDFVVVGAQTGPGAKPPQRQWVLDLANVCRSFEVPIFIKRNLQSVWAPSPLIQEWPAAMAAHLPPARLKESLRNTGVWTSELIQQLPCVAQVLND